MINRRKLLTGAAAIAAYGQIAHAQSISPQIGGGIGRGFDGGISGVNSGPAAPLVIPTGAIFALSRRKIAGWSGNALHVQRADSTFADIGFNSNNDWDTAQMTAFAGGTALTVAFPYDNSGSGNDATAVTGTLMPALNPAISPCMIMDGLMSTVTTRIVSLPAGVAFNENNCSIFAVVKPKAAIADQCFWGFDQTTTFVNMFSGNDLGAGIAGFTAGLSNGGTQYTSSKIVPMNKSILGLIGNGTAGTAFIDGNSIAIASGFVSRAIAGGFVGEMPGRAGAIAEFDLEAFFVWPRVLSGAEQTALFAALQSAFSIPSSFTGQVIVDGDSITASLGTSQNKSWSRTIADATPQYKFYNTGVNGLTLNAMQIASAQRTIARFNAGVAKNILVIWGGTNDIVGGTTGAATYAILQTYTSAAKTAGFKVVWVTMLPRTDLTTTPQAEWANYNTLMRGATLGQSNTADALADVQSDATMGPLAAASSHSLYINILPSNFSVGVHPTDAGTAFITPYIQNAINSL